MLATEEDLLIDHPTAAELEGSARNQDAEYDAAIDRALAAVLQPPGAHSAPANTSEVPRPARGIRLFDALLERSRDLRHENPDEMVRLAEWARDLVEAAGPRELGGPQAADLQSRAWVELGNAYRVADHLPKAEKALGRATDLYLQGTQDELLAARLFDVQASLLGDCRRFDLAETALDLVFTIHQRRGNPHLAGRALISKGMYVGYQGRPEEAIALIQQGLSLVDEEVDPGLLFLALHNLARLLLDCGRPREARIALWTLKGRRLDPGGRINELKVRWLEGQINAGLGKLDRAEMALLEVKRGFESSHLGYKAALVGLELGAVLLRRGRTADAVAEVLAAADVFLALRIAREAVVSVLLLKKGFERQITDAALLDHVIHLLHGAEETPAVRVLPPARE
jgi:tetratricopeptide (TPR) repeat protein